MGQCLAKLPDSAMSTQRYSKRTMPCRVSRTVRTSEGATIFCSPSGCSFGWVLECFYNALWDSFHSMIKTGRSTLHRIMHTELPMLCKLLGRVHTSAECSASSKKGSHSAPQSRVKCHDTVCRYLGYEGLVAFQEFDKKTSSARARSYQRCSELGSVKNEKPSARCERPYHPCCWRTCYLLSKPARTNDRGGFRH
eukprot:4089106-Amphidinium_carterae.1